MAGASGVVQVLDFDGTDVVPSFTANTAVLPDKCKTAAYVAGANEIAIVDLEASVVLNAVSSAALYVSIAISENGAAPPRVGAEGVEGFGDEVASAGVLRRVPLVAGTSYVFGTRFETAASVSVFRSYCTGVVTIVHRP